MPMPVKNFAAVKDAEVTQHTLAFVSRMLAAAENQATCHFIVAHKWTGDAYTLQVYHFEAHHIYQAGCPRSIRGWLESIAKERKNLKLLNTNEVFRLQVVEDRDATAVGWA